MIVATAGHVDHGKSSLIRVLTGVETDRLPEEKRRGLSIDLGFAYMPGGDGQQQIGFVDVPGHERFVRNMIAGVVGVDLAMLVVAADDGLMPQTREHLAILSLLGIGAVLIVVSKIDLVDAARVAEVSSAAEQLSTECGLQALATHPVSAQSGDGLDELKSALRVRAAATRSRDQRGHARLAIDRSFSVSGAGTVVTGTLFSGSVQAEQNVVLLSSGEKFRIRGLHAQNQQAEEAVTGQRCALNLTGAEIRNANFARGDWLLQDFTASAVRSMDVKIVVSPFHKELLHWTPAHLHVGTVDVTCRIALLETRKLLSGESAYARLICAKPLGAVHGDAYVLRDQSAQFTIAGGRVLDPLPPARGRERPERIEILKALDNGDPLQALADVLAESSAGIDLYDYARRINATEDEIREFCSRESAVLCGKLPNTWAVAQSHWPVLISTVHEALRRWHQQFPEVQGPGEYQLISRLNLRLHGRVLTAVLQDLIEKGSVSKKGSVYSLRDWRVRMSAEDEQRWSRLEPEFRERGLRAPRVVELAKMEDTEPSVIEQLLNHAVACGLLFRVSRNRYYLPTTLYELGLVAEELARCEKLTVADFRDASGIGRNLSVEMLEFFDTSRLTQRLGETRVLIGSSAECFGG